MNPLHDGNLKAGPPFIYARAMDGPPGSDGPSAGTVLKARRPQQSRPGGVPWPENLAATTKWRPFETMSKRRRSYPSESRVKRGRQFVHGDVELAEKLGRNDPCPCGSGQKFQALLSRFRTL